MAVDQRHTTGARRGNSIAVTSERNVAFEGETFGSREHGVVEVGRELTVVFTVPFDSSVVAKHGQPVDLDGGALQFHGGMPGAFGVDRQIGQVHPPTGARRHGPAVVDLQCGKARIVVPKFDALKP